MESLIKIIEKGKPFFEKISQNPYLRAIRDGFISLIPVILFSSIFLLLAFVPDIFGYIIAKEQPILFDKLLKAYGYSMGIVGLLMAATISKSLTDTFNKDLPRINQINSISVMIAALIAFLLIGVDQIDGGIALVYTGTKGLLTAFVVGFIVPNIYKFCIKNNLTIKMPAEVPPNISQTFKDLIPITISVILFWGFDWLFRSTMGEGFSAWIIDIFKPLFSVADGYMGLAIIFGAMAFFWFVGIHGPSIVEPIVAAAYLINVEANFKLVQAGEHATNVLSQGSQYFVATIGGTGATFIITYMFAFMARSKQLKAVGKASSIPVMFGVNEPVLFGAPLVLNPIFFIPFICAPIANVWLLKAFIDFVGMNGFIYNLPWTTPGPLGIIMGTGFALQAFILVIVILAIDFLIYYPFFKVYDLQLANAEQEKNVVEVTDAETHKADKQIFAQEIKSSNNQIEKSILVLCANGATSGMLANAIQKGAEQNSLNIQATAMAYGQHKDIIGDFDLIILAPQMASMLDELQQYTQNYKTQAVSTAGAEYVALARDPIKAIEFVLKNITRD